MATPRIAHHDICFGCGLANPFGLQLELEADPAGGLVGRFFVKQDHQGGSGTAHTGILAAALEEAMSLAVGDAGPGSTVTLELERRGSAPVGAYLHATARLVESEAGEHRATAELRGSDGELVAAGRAAFVEPAGGR